jgi:hypothetical protein
MLGRRETRAGWFDTPYTHIFLMAGLELYFFPITADLIISVASIPFCPQEI